MEYHKNTLKVLCYVFFLDAFGVSCPPLRKDYDEYDDDDNTYYYFREFHHGSLDFTTVPWEFVGKSLTPVLESTLLDLRLMNS